MNLKEAKFWADNGMFASVTAKVECGTATIAAASSKEVVDWLIAEVERLSAARCDASCCNSRFVRGPAEAVRG